MNWPIKNNEPPEHMRSKESGSTTLDKCGWCKYASGTHRFGYCIEGRCSLMKKYSNEIKWQDDCHLKNMSKNEIQSVIKHKEYYIKENKNTIDRENGYIKDLEKIKKNAFTMPPLPDDRSHDHFNVGDRIAVYLMHDEKRPIDKSNKWYFGTVKYGYRHHDGCVSYRLNGYGPQDKDFWGCGMSVGCVMLLDHYEFFRQNPELYKLWRSKTKYSGDI